MSDKIYVIGHRSPDLDSIAAAISYANFKNIKEKTDLYIPARAGEVNKVTKFILEKFGLDEPVLLESLKDQKLVLVDHNELAHRADGGGEAIIKEIVDHHKMDFKYKDPIEIKVLPWGSSNTIIADMYFKNKIEPDKNLAGLMLSAILDDTVITKSPTCTEIDKKYINKLAKDASISDWKEYGMEMFKKKASVAGKSAIEIIQLDYKDFEFSQGKFGIGQVETVDLGEFEDIKQDLIGELERLREKEGYHTTILFITDIMKEGSLFLVSSADEAKLEEAFDINFKNHECFLDGVMSRKKQVTPPLAEMFDKNPQR